MPWFFSLPEGLADYKSPGAVILDREGKVMARLPGDGYYLGESRALNDIPRDFIQATLAAEDKRFFSHGGMDFLALARAVVSNARSGHVVSGASTISQQLIKISSPRGPRTLGVKIREFFQSRRLEMLWSKEEMLAAYFDRLDYGNLRIGPVAAARFYFSKQLKDLSLAENALLTALPQAPTRLNPLRNPDLSMKRRNWILRRMESELGYSPEKIGRALKEELMSADSPEKDEIAAPHVMSRLLRKKANGTIRTTLDSDLQKEVRDIVQRELALLKDQEAGQAAVLVMDNETGDILAWIGSANRKDTHGGQMDGVLIPRSAGSTLKPFVYAMGFRAGAWAGEIVPDVQTLYRNTNGADAPRNFNNRYRGPLSIREALACSQNIPAMRMLDRVGGAPAFVAFLRNMGFESLHKNRMELGLGLAIGNAEVRLLELVEAYAALARGGERIKARLESSSPGEKDYLLSREISYMLADILSDDSARAAAFGRDSVLNLPFRCAVKTGTSSDYRDNWCIGFTKEVTVGVWVGNFDYRVMKGVSGVSGAGPIFHETMLAAHRRRPSSFPEPPEGLVLVKIDSRNGLRVEEASGLAAPEYIREEWAFRDSLPRFAEKKDYDEQGRALLDMRYEEWYRSEDNVLKNQYALDQQEWGRERPRILIPGNGSTLVLDPEMPGSGRLVRLKSNLPSQAKWSSPTLRIISKEGHSFAELVPGTHTLKVTCVIQGKELTASSRITVKTL